MVLKTLDALGPLHGLGMIRKYKPVNRSAFTITDSTDRLACVSATASSMS